MKIDSVKLLTLTDDLSAIACYNGFPRRTDHGSNANQRPRLQSPWLGTGRWDGRPRLRLDHQRKMSIYFVPPSFTDEQKIRDGIFSVQGTSVFHNG